MIIQRIDNGMTILKAIEVIAKNDEKIDSKKGTLTTRIHMVRGKSISTDDNNYYELWFEYPTHEEPEVEFTTGMNLYIVGKLVSTDDIMGKSLDYHIHVNELFFTEEDFKKYIITSMAETLNIRKQVLTHDNVYSEIKIEEKPDISQKDAEDKNDPSTEKADEENTEEENTWRSNNPWRPTNDSEDKTT